MNNGRSNTTTGIWWVKDSAMADNWGIHRAPPPQPTSTSGIPHPSTRGQTEAVFIAELKDYSSPLPSTQHLLFRFLEGLAFICLFCFSLSFFSPLLASLSNTFEAISESAMTFLQRQDLTRFCSLRQDREPESSWRLRVWMWASQSIAVQSCCFVIIDFSFTKLSCTSCIHISFLT